MDTVTSFSVVLDAVDVVVVDLIVVVVVFVVVVVLLVVVVVAAGAVTGILRGGGVRSMLKSYRPGRKERAERVVSQGGRGFCVVEVVVEVSVIIAVVSTQYTHFCRKCTRVKSVAKEKMYLVAMQTASTTQM